MSLSFSFHKNPLFSIFHKQKPKLCKTLKLMAAKPSCSKRAVCNSCSKPSQLCLCSRFKKFKLDNSIAVTILQHSLEQNHPLNSTRIALLGLKNVEILRVFDVHFNARFAVWPLCSDSEVGIECFNERNNGSKEISNFEKLDSGLKRNSFRSIISDSEMGIGCFDERNNGSKEKSVFEESALELKNSNDWNENLYHQKIPITFSISKHGVTSPDFDLLLGSAKVLNALSKGFVVKKWQHKLVNGKTTDEELEEFEIVVPHGSALLFPSEKSVGIEALDFEVKNLIVLDGTWNKAKRIYSENPWLKVLPHLKLDVDKMSLYSEVRRQPRAGYLSTIESIVYAMKGLGDKTYGLCNLLEVFESMVVDQRRCKDERLSNISVR